MSDNVVYSTVYNDERMKRRFGHPYSQFVKYIEKRFLDLGRLDRQS